MDVLVDNTTHPQHTWSLVIRRLLCPSPPRSGVDASPPPPCSLLARFARPRSRISRDLAVEFDLRRCIEPMLAEPLEIAEWPEPAELAEWFEWFERAERTEPEALWYDETDDALDVYEVYRDAVPVPVLVPVPDSRAPGAFAEVAAKRSSCVVYWGLSGGEGRSC